MIDRLSETGNQSLDFLRGGSRQTAHEYVREMLRRAILNGDLTSGSRLVQAELAASLEVSTTPVREALRDLSAEGLVRFDPHRGAVVAEIDKEELHEIFEIREILEPHAMRMAVEQMTDHLLTNLRKVHQRMIDDPHSATFVDLNRTFHMAIYEAGTSPRMLAILRSLEDAAVMYIGAALKKVPGLRETAIHDHGRILEALERRDADAAIEALLQHLKLPITAIEGVTGSS
ncbi:MAG TPA: GntR family transcriptional regulator [Acidimicrobiia bacterium]